MLRTSNDRNRLGHGKKPPHAPVGALRKGRAMKGSVRTPAAKRPEVSRAVETRPLADVLPLPARSRRNGLAPTRPGHRLGIAWRAPRGRLRPFQPAPPPPSMRKVKFRRRGPHAGSRAAIGVGRPAG